MDKSELKRVGILGGTFDPPHLAHLRIAEEIRETYKLDKVFFIPSFSPPHKITHFLSPFSQRLEMVALSIENNPFFEVLDIEKEIVPSYTLKTLQKLKGIYPSTDFFLIIGWDSFCEFETWWNYKEFIKYTHIIVIPRRIKSLKEAQNYFYAKIKELWSEESVLEKIYFYPAEFFNVSSTLIRNLCKEGKSVRYLVSEKVYFYIKEKGLYKK